MRQYRGVLQQGPPDKVQHVPVSQEQCEVMNDPQQMIFPGMMCVGGEHGEDACQVGGDDHLASLTQLCCNRVIVGDL